MNGEKSRVIQAPIPESCVFGVCVTEFLLCGIAIAQGKIEPIGHDQQVSQLIDVVLGRYINFKLCYIIPFMTSYASEKLLFFW